MNVENALFSPSHAGETKRKDAKTQSRKGRKRLSLAARHSPFGDPVLQVRTRFASWRHCDFALKSSRLTAWFRFRVAQPRKVHATMAWISRKAGREVDLSLTQA